LHWTAVAALAAIAALLVAVAGPIKDWWMPQEPPGTIFVIKPSAVVAPIFATPVMTEYPVTFVKAGSQFRLDCVKSVDNYKYNFGHISEGIHQNRWLDINDLVLPNGDPPFRALAELPELDICK
jgi:hypothetical protein